jgi:glycosyltransferase involved in cell wall biosynthesis
MIPGLVSVMMPAYNAERYIASAIESVLAQSYSDWELLVVDDGSTDPTGEIAAGVGDPRVRVLRQANGGEAAARNHALRSMRGEYLAFLDSDDRFLPEHLARTVGFLKDRPEVDGVYTDGYHIDSYDNRLPLLSARRRGPYEGSIFEALVRASDVFGPPICVVLRAERVHEKGCRFDERIVIGPDWDFFVHYSEHARFGYIDRPTCLYRVHLTNISVSAGKRVRLESLRRCREKAIHLPGFANCSVETRSYAFYDLILNLLTEEPERQQEVTTWDRFRELPKSERARLLRLMAGRAVAQGHDSHWAHYWLRRSLRLHPLEPRSWVVGAMLKLTPSVAARWLAFRYRTELEEAQRSPFHGLAETGKS